MLRASWCRLTK